VVFGSVWALLGWTPLLLPSLHWHSYYSIFGSMGAWLALSVPITRRPWVVALVVIALAGLRAGRSTTMFNDWGEESYVRRAGRTLDVLRRDLVAECPSPRPFTRFYFTDVPAGAGFLIGDGPALRSWYGEPTLTGGFLRDFKARRASEPAGADRFFRYDPARGWVELVAGREDVDAARRSDPSWQRDHDRLARTLTEGGDWGTARAEYAKLAQAVPDSAGYAYMAGLAAMTLGDSLEARRWIAIAVANPAADDEMRAVGASMGIHAPDRARRRPTPR
jgi:hypothetical protein